MRRFVLARLACCFATVFSATPAVTQATVSTTPSLLAPPRLTRGCAVDSGSPLWRTGAVFVDTTNLVTRHRQIVAVSWCMYLSGGTFEPYDTIARWTDLQEEQAFTFDAGIEWARSTADMFSRTRISFRVDQTDSGRVDRFIVTSTIERADSVRWNVAAVHRIPVTVSKDTARFESPFATTLNTSLRFVAAPLEFIRLDGGLVDTTRALSAAAFVTNVRGRLGITSPPHENILYVYTKSDNGRALLGYSQFDVGIDGFSGKKPIPFLFANVATAGETYWHELVHAALSVRTPALDQSLEESLSKALGGTLHRTWPEFTCEDRALILRRELVKDIPSLLAKPDAELKTSTVREWETAFLIDYLAMKSGDTALRTLVNGTYDLSSRSATRISIASIIGIAPAELIGQVSDYNSEKALGRRCAKT